MLARSIATALACALVSVSPGALAQSAGPTKLECATAYEQAQIAQRREGKLRAAKKHLEFCLQAECPEGAREVCGPLMRQVEDSMPSIVVDATDAAGATRLDVRVSMGPDLLVERLDG